MKLRTKIALTTLAFTPLALIAPSPAYAAPLAYHAKNSSTSDQQIWIYANSDCTGSSIERWPGQTVTSNGWDCARAYGNVTVALKAYNDTTGNYITTRYYDGNTNIALGSNDYVLVVTQD